MVLIFCRVLGKCIADIAALDSILSSEIIGFGLISVACDNPSGN